MEKFKAFFNKTFWQSVAGTILFYLIVEKFGVFSNSIVNFYISLNTSFSNSFYASLAKNNPFEINILVFLVALWFFSMFLGFKLGECSSNSYNIWIHFNKLFNNHF